MRTFIATEIPESIRDVIVEYQRPLRAMDSGVRWVGREQMHLTLKFLGEIREDQVGRITAELARVASEVGPFDAEVAGVGAFPAFQRPTVLWVGVEPGQAELGGLAGRIEAAMEPLGFPREKREFQAHLTLGRVKSPRGVPGVCARMRSDERRSFGRFRVQEIVLFQSTLTQGGAIYTALERFSLRGG